MDQNVNLMFPHAVYRCKLLFTLLLPIKNNCIWNPLNNVVYCRYVNNTLNMSFLKVNINLIFKNLEKEFYQSGLLAKLQTK